MNNTLKTVLIAAGASVLSTILVVFVFGLVSGEPAQDNVLGALGFNRYPNSGVSARYFNTSPTSSTAGRDGSISISGDLTVTGITNSSGTSIGGGTNATLMRCTTTSKSLPAIDSGATTTVSFSLTGVSTSSNQVYWFGHNTSSAGFATLAVGGFIPSSTANGMDVTLFNPSSTLNTTFAAKGTSTFSLCYLQF